MEVAWKVRPILLVLLLTVTALLPVVMSADLPVGGGVAVRSRVHARPYVFPGGGRQLFPKYRLVALYGAPGSAELGALGEQDAEHAVGRVKQLAAQYQPFMSERALPTLEIITTVASSGPTDDGDYAYAIDKDTVRQWVSLARSQGVYVVIDLQPGRSDFLTLAKQWQDILQEPNVGLALDPEWRLSATQVPLQQIGSVDITEVNATAAWLADLTKVRRLPQKLFLLHEFSTSMLPNRAGLYTSRSELAYALQMDGQGTQAAKEDSWRAVTAEALPNLHFGWKNFYTKDSPLRLPEDTMKLNPEPWYVSYQ